MKCPKCGYENSGAVLYCNLCYEVLKKGVQVIESTKTAGVESVQKHVNSGFVFRISTFSIHISIAVAQALIIFNVPFEQLQYFGAQKGNILSFVTYSFCHVDSDHFFKNLSSHLIFGTIAALSLTPVKYILLYVSTAVCGALYFTLQHNSDYVLIGSSGVTRGLMGFAVTLLLFRSYSFQYVKYLKILVFSLAIMLLGKDILFYFLTTEPVEYSVHFLCMFCGIIFCLLFEINRSSSKRNSINV